MKPLLMLPLLLLMPLVTAGPKVQLQKAPIDAKPIDFDTKSQRVSYGPCLWTLGGASSRFCRSSRECCPPQVCARAPASKYGYCAAAGEVKCSPACGPDQWCAPGKTRGTRRGGSLTSRPSATSYTCRDKRTPLDCFTNAHCPGGHICRITPKGNCCYPTTCSPKCRPGFRCRRLFRSCAPPPPFAGPCYCPPVYKCERVKPPTTKKPTRCKPPCSRGQRCVPSKTVRKFPAIGNKYTCVTEQCQTNAQCRPGHVCRKHKRGNCCYPTTCSPKCRPGWRCQKLLRRCARPPPNASPCYCPPFYRCRRLKPPVTKPPPTKPPAPRCEPPCRRGQRCALLRASSDLLTVVEGKKPTCVTDACQTDSECPAGSSCRQDARGNCCYPTSCPKPCPIGERCEVIFPSCPRPRDPAPPCYCPPFYRCYTRCTGLRCPIG